MGKINHTASSTKSNPVGVLKSKEKNAKGHKHLSFHDKINADVSLPHPSGKPLKAFKATMVPNQEIYVATPVEGTRNRRVKPQPEIAPVEIYTAIPVEPKNPFQFPEFSYAELLADLEKPEIIDRPEFRHSKDTPIGVKWSNTQEFTSYRFEIDTDPEGNMYKSTTITETLKHGPALLENNVFSLEYGYAKGERQKEAHFTYKKASQLNHQPEKRPALIDKNWNIVVGRKTGTFRWEKNILAVLNKPQINPEKENPTYETRSFKIENGKIKRF